MIPGKPATIVIDERLTRGVPLIELEALTGKAVALLACCKEAISATIFKKPHGTGHGSRVMGDGSYWLSLMDVHHNMISLVELKPQAPVVDFEIVNHALSDLVGTG